MCVLFCFGFVLNPQNSCESSRKVTLRVLWPINAPSSWRRTRPSCFHGEDQLALAGKHTKNLGKSPFWIGKSTISMEIYTWFIENHHFEWENQVFLRQFSIAMLVYQKVTVVLVVHPTASGIFQCSITRGYSQPWTPRSCYHDITGNHPICLPFFTLVK